MDHLGIGLAGQEGEEIGRDLAFLDLADARPLWRLDAGEKRHRSVDVKGEPDVTAGGRVELGETGERHDATELRLEPAAPMGAFDIADIGGSAVRLLAQQIGELVGRERAALLGLDLRRPLSAASSSARSTSRSSSVSGPGSRSTRTASSKYRCTSSSSVSGLSQGDRPSRGTRIR